MATQSGCLLQQRGSAGRFPRPITPAHIHAAGAAESARGYSLLTRSPRPITPAHIHAAGAGGRGLFPPHPRVLPLNARNPAQSHASGDRGSSPALCPAFCPVCCPLTPETTHKATRRAWRGSSHALLPRVLPLNARNHAQGHTSGVAGQQPRSFAPCAAP